MRLSRERLMARVRKFELADLDRVLEIEQASFGQDAWDQKLFLAYHRKFADLFLIAAVGRRIAGYIITCAGFRNAELASIAVDRRHRRHGVGQAMLDHTLAKLRESRIKTWWLMVSVDNHAGIHFYNKYGFERTKRVRRYYGAGRDAWRMRYSLKATKAARGTIPATAP
jgi:ribosomal-protein-alanine N-acetyltransferase